VNVRQGVGTRYPEAAEFFITLGPISEASQAQHRCAARPRRLSMLDTARTTTNAFRPGQAGGVNTHVQFQPHTAHHMRKTCSAVRTAATCAQGPRHVLQRWRLQQCRLMHPRNAKTMTNAFRPGQTGGVNGHVQSQPHTAHHMRKTCSAVRTAATCAPRLAPRQHTVQLSSLRSRPRPRTRRC